jgi:hypothetical protein
MDNIPVPSPGVKSWTFKIPKATPSGNTVLRSHWSVRRRENQDLHWLVLVWLPKNPPIPPATGKRRLIIERHAKRALDLDNLAAGAKCLIDVIKVRKLILDDRPDCCELVFRQVVDSVLAPYTLLTLEEIA